MDNYDLQGFASDGRGVSDDMMRGRRMESAL